MFWHDASSGRAAFWCHVAPDEGQVIKSDLAYTAAGD
jgi:hypothetical protein